MRTPGTLQATRVVRERENNELAITSPFSEIFTTMTPNRFSICNFLNSVKKVSLKFPPTLTPGYFEAHRSTHHVQLITSDIFSHLAFQARISCVKVTAISSQVRVKFFATVHKFVFPAFTSNLFKAKV